MKANNLTISIPNKECDKVVLKTLNKIKKESGE
jgi:hypothetical protein